MLTNHSRPYSELSQRVHIYLLFAATPRRKIEFRAKNSGPRPTPPRHTPPPHPIPPAPSRVPLPILGVPSLGTKRTAHRNTPKEAAVFRDIMVQLRQKYPRMMMLLLAWRGSFNCENAQNYYFQIAGPCVCAYLSSPAVTLVVEKMCIHACCSYVTLHTSKHVHSFTWATQEISCCSFIFCGIMYIPYSHESLSECHRDVRPCPWPALSDEDASTRRTTWITL